MPRSPGDAAGVVISLGRRRRARDSWRRDLWIAALALGALVALLLVLARPFDARAGAGDDPGPSLFGG